MSDDATICECKCTKYLGVVYLYDGFLIAIAVKNSLMREQQEGCHSHPYPSLNHGLSVKLMGNDLSLPQLDSLLHSKWQCGARMTAASAFPLFSGFLK
jgi:hypothetical protein